MESTPQPLERRNTVAVLKNSLQDRPQTMSSDSEVRYKLVIDPSEDDSLIRILFTFDILSERNAKLYVSSDFPGDGNIQKVNALSTSASVVHSDHVLRKDIISASVLNSGHVLKNRPYKVSIY